MRVVLLITICFLTLNSFASEIMFFQKSSDEALELAKKMDKPFFVFYCGRWCPTCKVMEEHTFTDDAVADFAAQNFIAFKANIDEPTGKEWKERYGVYVVPTVIFFDRYGQQQDLHASTLSAIAFLDIMKRNAALSSNQYNMTPVSLVTFPTTVTQPVVAMPTQSTPTTQEVTPNIANVVEKQSSLPDIGTKINSKEKLLKNEIIDEHGSKEASEKEKIAALTKRAESETLTQSLTENKKNDNETNNDASAIQHVVMTNGKIWAASNNKKSKAKEEKIVAAVNEDAIVELKKEVAITKPVGQPSVRNTSPNAINKNTSDVEKPTRPKIKSIVLNPKKNVAPRNIVIRTTRTESIVPSTNTVAPAPHKVVSMVVNQPVNQNSSIYSTSYLQLGYFENHTNASALAAKVRRQFYNNIISLKETNVDGMKMYRVTMQGFQSKDQAAKMKTQLKAAGFKSYIFEN